MSSLSVTGPGRRRLRILRRPTESIRPSSPRPQRRDCHGRLGTALLALAGEYAAIDAAGFRPWCSATFIGAQHRITLRLEGPDAAQRAAALADALPEAELSLPGHIVADVAVDALRAGDGGAMLVDVAVLTVEDW